MKLEPAKIWKPGDDIWDLCAMQQDALLEGIRLPGYIFTHDLLCARTGELAKRGIGANTVLTRALPELLSGRSPKIDYNRMAVGTDGREPHKDQDRLYGLVSVADGMTTGGPHTDGPVTIDSYTWTYTGFWPSDYANYELKEVGMQGGSVGLLNRAIIYDLDGITPMGITKTSAFILRITGQINFRFVRA